MNEIRPTLPNAFPAAAPAPSEAARAAQAAFFRAALGQASAAAASPAPARPAMATQLAAQAAVTPTAGAAPAERSSRPGALLDIRV